MARYEKTACSPACWLIAPKSLPDFWPGVRQLRILDSKALALGTKLRVVIYDEDTPIVGFFAYALDHPGPRAEDLGRMYARIKDDPEPRQWFLEGRLK